MVGSTSVRRLSNIFLGSVKRGPAMKSAITTSSKDVMNAKSLSFAKTLSVAK